MRILSRSSRKCTVTGIDSHELQGLDVVQCAALVETNHGIVNLTMNEYPCYGKGHIDGYAMPLSCRGGLMCLSILGKPTDTDWERYAAVHLTRPHEWDPSVLDYTHPSVMENFPSPMILMRDLPLILTLMSLGITPKGQYKLSVSWMTLHPL